MLECRPVPCRLPLTLMQAVGSCAQPVPRICLTNRPQVWWFLALCLGVFTFGSVASSFWLVGQDAMYPPMIVAAFVGEQASERQHGLQLTYNSSAQTMNHLHVNCQRTSVCVSCKHAPHLACPPPKCASALRRPRPQWQGRSSKQWGSHLVSWCADKPPFSFERRSRQH